MIFDYAFITLLYAKNTGILKMESVRVCYRYFELYFFVTEKLGEVAIKRFKVRVHIQYVISIGNTGMLEFGQFGIRQVGNDIRVLIIDNGRN